MIIEYDDFAKLKLVLGTITEIESVPKSDKLLKLIVAVGGAENRQIISGIKEFYPEPERLLGKQAVFLLNLRPRKIFGLESQGMLLGVQAGDNFSLLQTNKNFPDGTSVL